MFSTCGATKKLLMVAGSYYAPKENKSKPKGEDAHFISLEKQTLGVADGVGGWAKKGIDSGKYSRKLMKNSLAALTDLKPDEPVHPRRILQHAYGQTKVKGSSTACIVTIRGSKLHYANVGDSRFMVFRENKCVYTSPIQTRRFNCPCQLGNEARHDRPESAYVGKFEVDAGDVVVVGTDGLFDNVYKSEIEEILPQTERGALPEEVASMIGAVALANSVNSEYVSPFAKSARAVGLNHSGGKYDDITVVVARIEEYAGSVNPEFSVGRCLQFLDFSFCCCT